MIEYLAINYAIMVTIGIIGAAFFISAIAAFHIESTKVGYILLIVGTILSLISLFSPSRDYYCYVVKDHNKEFCDNYFDLQKTNIDLYRHSRQ